MTVTGSTLSNSLLAALMNEEVYQPSPPLGLIDAGLSDCAGRFAHLQGPLSQRPRDGPGACQ